MFKLDKQHFFIKKCNFHLKWGLFYSNYPDFGILLVPLQIQNQSSKTNQFYMSFSSIVNRIPPVTKNLLIINILIWAVMMLLPKVGAALNSQLALYYIQSQAFKPFQLLTYMFLHNTSIDGGFFHIFFNMFALWMFGSIIERALGSTRFLIYYLSCGFGAALIQEVVYAVMLEKYHSIFTPEYFNYIVENGYRALQMGQNYADPTYYNLNNLFNGATVGASGAIYGILLAFGMLFPNQPIYLMFIPIPIKAKWMVLGYGAIELLFGISGTASNVAHWAHLAGMLFGVIMILYWKKRGDFNDRWYF